VTSKDTDKFLFPFKKPSLCSRTGTIARAMVRFEKRIKKDDPSKAGVGMLLIRLCLLIFVFYAPIHNYVLAEDFPEDKIKIFNNFISFSAPCHIVSARLGLNDKISYGDFLSAVSMALAVQENYRLFRALPFVEKILEPLSHDLKTKEFRGYRFPVEDLPAFFRKRAAEVQYVLDGFYIVEGILSTPHEICMAEHYAQTFWSIYRGNPLGAYSHIINCPGPWPPSNRVFHSSEERHRWFLFLQAELHYAGYGAYAAQIMEIELEHYRELIVRRLRQRAYLTQSLYEIGDSTNLSTLKNMLLQELTDLRNIAALDSNFEKALDNLRTVDDKVRSEIVQGIIVLPWINRQALDLRMGRRVLATRRVSEVITEPEEWRMTRENTRKENSIDNEVKKVMEETYDWILCCIRVLATINERLYAEKSLQEMRQLHATLASNRNVSFRHRRDGMTVGGIILPWVEVRDEWFYVNH